MSQENRKSNTTVLTDALVTLVLGILFCIFKGALLGWLILAAGILLVVRAVIDAIRGAVPIAIVEAVIGILAIIFFGKVATIGVYVMGALMVIWALLQLWSLLSQRVKTDKWWYTLLVYLRPLLTLTVGILLLCNPGGTVNTLFIIEGIILIVEGACSLVAYLLQD